MAFDSTFKSYYISYNYKRVVMKRILFVGTPQDESYYHATAEHIKGCRLITTSKRVADLGTLETVMAKGQFDGVLTTRADLLALLVDPRVAKDAKINNYLGSMFKTPLGREVVIVPPLNQLYPVPHTGWLLNRYASKLINKQAWLPSSEFNWKEIKTEDDLVSAYEEFLDGVLASVDTETIKEPLGMDMVGYCVRRQDGTTISYLIYLDDMKKIEWMRELNATPIPKVLQNGKYDCAYFCGYSAPLCNYIGDTKVAMHSWMAEIPKDLGFLTPLLVREAYNWKALSDTGSLADKKEYCARDCWGTLEAFIGWMAYAPTYAWTNYVKKQRLMPATHYNEMKGIKVDIDVYNRNSARLERKRFEAVKSLATMIGEPMFNPNSPKQVAQLATILGHGTKCKKTGEFLPPESTAEKELKNFMLAHPISERIFGKVLEVRGLTKLIGTYLPTGAKSKLFKDRWLYSIDQNGTDTGRAASKGHHYWIGESIQTIPGENEDATAVKQSLVADEGYIMVEIDKSQAEARGVAYCSGDENLLRAVDSGKDFHSLNASAFFGIPYEQIYQDPTPEFWDSETGQLVAAAASKTLNKQLRNLSKRVNHGANYNMGPAVLLDTMGASAVREAQRLLNLSPSWTLLQVTTYLLGVYEKTYPKVKTVYYRKIISDVVKTRMLVGATGWTRYCFKDPTRDKLALNSYVAHVTQSLNAMDLDEGYLKIFNWWINTPSIWDKIQILAMIHDSVLHQTRIGYEHLSSKVQELLHNPIQVTDSIGKVRTLDVPTDLTFYGKRWGGNSEHERHRLCD